MLVTRLSDVPRLVAALHKADPGEMLSRGFFNDPIGCSDQGRTLNADVFG